jgi:heterodisulfide reductase subunit A
MYTAKHAKLYKHHVPDGQAYVFYIDIRAGGKGYEEFVTRTMEDEGVLYLRGKVSKVFEENGKLVVWGVDTLAGQDIEIRADMVVLAMAIRPSSGAEKLAKILKAAQDTDGFFAEAHPKLRPVESLTAGIFLAGVAQAPKDIPDTVAQAGGAAIKVMSILSQPELLHSPLVAQVNEPLCTGCGMCIEVCPFTALTLKEGKAEVNEVLCEGCGTCAATCLRSAIEVRNLTHLQVHDMLSVCLGGLK